MAVVAIVRTIIEFSRFQTLALGAKSLDPKGDAYYGS